MKKLQPAQNRASVRRTSLLDLLLSRPVFLSWLLVIACLSRAEVFAARNQQTEKAEKWEKEIAAMEAKIASGATQTGRVLFVGSSSIRLWKLDQSFPDLKPVNHGFGGSELSDAVRYFDRLVVPARPAAVVIYAGDNDIGGGKKAEQVVHDFETFVRLSREKLAPGTPVLFIAIKPSLKRWALAPIMQTANEQISRICAQSADLTFVDIWQPMLGSDKMPRAELFLKDGLHLNEEGYRLWTAALLPKIEAAFTRLKSAPRQP